MKKNYVQIIMTLLIALLMVSLTACGNEDTMAVVEENATATPVATEEPAKEEDEAVPDATYVEINNLKYEESTQASINGLLYVGDDIETLKVIEANWELTNVEVEDTEDGTKTVVTIEQSVEGYIWSDGQNIFATNLNVPVARLADSNSGLLLCAGDEDAVETEIKWKDNIYNVNASETASWDDDWSTAWYTDPNDDGQRFNTRLDVKTVVMIDKGYEDALALVLTPLDKDGSVGKYIMDIWSDESHLFNVNDMRSVLVAKAEAVEETDADEAEASVEDESKEESKSEEEKPSETVVAKQEEIKSAHSHDYAKTVTAQPTCTGNGVITYVCQTCGSSYTESIATVPHDFSVPVVQMVHHDEQWKRTPQYVEDHSQIIDIRSGCGIHFSSLEEYEAHVSEHIVCAGCYVVTYGTKLVYDEEKIADAYDAEEIVGYQCSMCGKSTVR